MLKATRGSVGQGGHGVVQAMVAMLELPRVAQIPLLPRGQGQKVRPQPPVCPCLWGAGGIRFPAISKGYTSLGATAEQAASQGSTQETGTSRDVCDSLPHAGWAEKPSFCLYFIPLPLLPDSTRIQKAQEIKVRSVLQKARVPLEPCPRISTPLLQAPASAIRLLMQGII